MTRRFTMQMGGRGEVHGHTCELCGDRWPCGDRTCDVDLEHIASPEELALSNVATCTKCLTARSCLGCEQPIKLRWDSDTADADGNMVRTNYTAECPCGIAAGYTDLHDGRGPLVTVYTSAKDRHGGIINVQSEVQPEGTLSILSTTVTIPMDDE